MFTKRFYIFLRFYLREKRYFSVLNPPHPSTIPTHIVQKAIHLPPVDPPPHVNDLNVFWLSVTSYIAVVTGNRKREKKIKNNGHRRTSSLECLWSYEIEEHILRFYHYFL